MTTTLEIITGTSFFSNGAIVGVTLKGDSDCVAVCKWAESASTTAWGRPAATQTLNGRPEADQIAYLRSRWLEWASHNNISIKFTKAARRNVGAF